jgi:para-nitrobenzyl esterase
MHITRASAAVVTLLISAVGQHGRLLAQSDSGAPQHPVVTTDKGKVRGYQRNGVYRYLGIPYAAPPVGDLRWRPPEEAASWDNVRAATKYGPTCAQITTLGVFAGPANSNEDCLYLNVWTPTLARAGTSDTTGLPVIVWIHGGGLVDGESNDYDGSKLASQEPTVVVTINYRLGLLGYLGHPALDAEGHDFGNYGLMDQQMALQWVKQNIAKFGGDPNNVTLGGQSAGSTSTAAAVISPASAGLFHRAIFQSGALLNVAPLELAEQRGTAFAEAAGCPGSSASTAACLRALPAQQIMELQGTESANGPYVTGLMVDGTVLPTSADSAWESGNFNHMPVMNGTVQDEANFGIGITEYFSGPPRAPLTDSGYVATITRIYSGPAGAAGGPPNYPTGTVDSVLAHYPLSNYATPQLAYDAVGSNVSACRARHLNQLISQWVPTYAYEFNYQDAPYYFPRMPGFVPLAAHTIDIQFLFPHWHGGSLGIRHPLNTAEQQLSDTLTDFWEDFARMGNPNNHGNSPWPQFKPNHEVYLSQHLGGSTTFEASEFSDRHQCDFWDRVLIY